MRGKIIIASSVAAEIKLTGDILRRAGHTIAAETGNLAHTLRRIRSLYCDIAVIDSNLDGGKGLKAAEIINQDQLAAVLLIIDSDAFAGASNYHYMIRPVNYNSLVPAVESALLYRRRESELREQIKKLQDNLETRKIIDKAKGLLIDKMGMSENEAHRLIQREAMKGGITLKSVASEILLKLGNKE